MVVPESSLNISPMQQLQLKQQQQQNSLLQSAPPGLQFLGRSIPTGNIILSGQNPVQTQLVAQPLQQAADGIFIDVNTGQQVFGQPVLQQNGGSVIFSGQAPLRTQLVAQPLQHTAGGIFIDANTGQQVFAQTASQQNGGGLIFVDNPSLPTQGNPIFDSVGQAATLGVTPGQPSFSQQGIPIPNSQHLRLIGLTPRGDLIIDGPGGTITIGADVLNGIITPNAFPVATEFEELENELLRGTRGNKNKVKVLDPGNGAITLEKKTPAGRNNGGSGLKTVEASSSSSTADTKAVAAASSSASAGGASASSSAGSASASSNSLTGRVVLGNGVTLNNGVITIDSAAGNSQLNIGGISHGHQSEGASGIQAPGNATILITG
ncbi:uncharacterized protein LOC127867564 [Dreissena polymorpha]|uniref:Uncharacterized protein n=1 Tax=Dreissena polymorpha TaxID=45954 RepID=A0A9D4LZG7_DREPO|nr:uncharacterized protein LOC127867564 [Dreissena polymorpha]KAH3867548.1 hypothetical protein DPMN_030680 [Dreissena polymorpha]